MIENLKDLEKLLRVLRKQGVYEFEHGTTKLKLGDLPVERAQEADAVPGVDYTGFPQGELTPEQLMYYSTGGSPDDDPALKDKAN